jgi:squalene synthase HpnC
VVGSDPALARAYTHCERLAREHYENFPVASRLVPAPMRPHIAAIYAFARRADDFADEPGIADAERMRLLDGWLANLHVSAGVNASVPIVARDQIGEGDEWIFVALANTMRVHRLPVSLFEDLLSAFRQDVTTCRYSTWAEVLDYCRRSANPVGRLVLRVAGCDDPRVDMASDAVCSALQLTNFWQDLGRDWNNGRLYVPLEDIARAGAREEDLARNCATAEWRAVMATMVRRTRDLYAAGRSVCDALHGRLRWELRLTWLGGSRMLDKVEHLRRHSLRDRPTLNAGDLPALVRDALLWRAR